MENKSHAIIAITFLIVFSVGAVVVYMWMHRGPKEDRYYEIVSRYAVGGLQPEASVEFKGLRVGSVKGLRFDPRDPEKVLIRIGVFPDAYITHATYAQLGYQGITGMTYITLANEPGRPRTPLKTSSDHPARIPMRQGLLQTVEQAGKSDLKRINAIIDKVDRLLSDSNRRHLAATLRHLDEATRRLVALEGQLAPTLKSMPEITEATRKLLEETRRTEATVNRLANGARRPIEQIGQAADSAKRVGDSGAQLLRRINEDVLPRIDALARRMNRSIADIDQLTRQLKSQPQSLIFGPSARPPGPGEQGFRPPPQKE